MLRAGVPVQLPHEVDLSRAHDRMNGRTMASQPQSRRPRGDHAPACGCGPPRVRRA